MTQSLWRAIITPSHVAAILAAYSNVFSAGKRVARTLLFGRIRVAWQLTMLDYHFC